MSYTKDKDQYISLLICIELNNFRPFSYWGTI